MIFSATPLTGSYIISLEAHTDERGWFARTYCKNEFAQIGHNKEWVQMNHSFTAERGTVRGMHFQVRPYGEIKMVRCIAGIVYDVIIDLRQDSPCFLQWFGVELSAKNKKMMYIPEGFAHGFQALTNDCELLYQHTAYYTPGSESGIRYDDPAVHIQWPLQARFISERDAHHPYIDQNFKGL